MKRFHLHNRFEDKLKYKVEDFELVPSENIWNNIEAELDASKKKGKLLVAVLASTLLITSTAAGLYFGGVFDGNSTKTQLAENATETQMGNTATNKMDTPDGNYVNGSGADVLNTQEPVGNGNTEGNNAQANNNSRAVSQTPRQVDNRLVDMFARIRGERNNLEREGDIDGGIGEQGYPGGNRINNSIVNTKKEDEVETSIETKKEQNLSMPIGYNPADGRNVEQKIKGVTKEDILADADSRKPFEIKKPKGSKKHAKTHETNFFYGFSISPQYAYRKYNEYQGSLQSIKDFRNQTDGSIFGYTVGGDMYYNFKHSGLFLGLGLYYTSMGENIAVANVNDNGVPKTIAAEDTRARNTYNFIDIPLTATFRLNENSRGPKLDLKAGLVYSKLSKVDALLYDYVNEEYKPVFDKAAPQLNPNNVSAMFGVSAVVPLDNRDKNILTVGPMLRYNLLSTFADTYTAKQRNFNLGVQVSYIIRLDN